MIIVGDKEAGSNQVSIRFHDGSQMSGICVDEMMRLILTNIRENCHLYKPRVSH